MSNGTASVAILVIILFYGFIVFMDMAKYFFKKSDFEIDEVEEQLRVKKKLNVKFLLIFVEIIVS